MSNFARDTSLDSLKKAGANLKVQRNDANNTWVACIETPDGHRVHAENRDRYAAVVEAKTLARDYEANKVEAASPKLDSETSKWTISTDDPRIAGIGRASLETSLGSDAIQLQTLFAGLIEKAKRESLDGRLIAMANTDFERGFMALEKAINTNKG